MWYFAWILGTLLACAFGVITALALERGSHQSREERRNLMKFIATLYAIMDNARSGRFPY